MGSRFKNNSHGDGASPGKIFIGGLAKDTTDVTFNQHFEKYGEIIDSVIMKDRYTGQPRGFGFITYADPSVVDKVIEDTHIINGKQVEIKRTIPKGAGGSKEFKTRKIFVGGLPSTVTGDDLKDFFSKYGKVEEHQIIYDHETSRSRGFGFIVFESEDVVDEVLANGNRIDMAGTQVEIKKAEPKKASNPPPAPSYGRNSSARSFKDDFSGPYGGYDGGFGPGPYRTPVGYGPGPGPYRTPVGYGPGPGPYRTPGGFGSRFGEYGPYNSSRSEFGDYGLGGGYRDEPGYSSRYGAYGGGYSGGFGASRLGGYGRGSGYDSYDVGPSYGEAGVPYGGRGGYSSGSRYHPYAK